MHHEIKKASTFAAVGVINTAIGLSSIYYLRMVTGNEVLANIGGYCLALSVSYYLNGKITFSSTINNTAMVLRFILAFLLAWSINITIVLFFINLKLSPQLSHILGMPAYTLIFYLLSRFYVFSNQKKASCQ
jgi:putative flippase GtrA